MDQKTPGIKYFPIQPFHWVNTNKIHEFLTPNNSHSSLLNNLPINLSSKRLGPCKLGHVVFCSYLPHVCPLEQHRVCPMTLGKHNLQPWLPHLVAYKMLFFFLFLKQSQNQLMKFTSWEREYLYIKIVWVPTTII